MFQKQSHASVYLTKELHSTILRRSLVRLFTTQPSLNSKEFLCQV